MYLLSLKQNKIVYQCLLLSESIDKIVFLVASLSRSWIPYMVKKRERERESGTLFLYFSNNLKFSGIKILCSHFVGQGEKKMDLYLFIHYRADFFFFHDARALTSPVYTQHMYSMGNN